MMRHLKRQHSVYVETLGMDEKYGDGTFVAELGRLGIRAHLPAPHVRWRAPEPKTLSSLEGTR